MQQWLCRKCGLRHGMVAILRVNACRVTREYVCIGCADQGQRDASAEREESLAELRRALGRAIEREDYEQAAMLRDAINDLRDGGA